MFGGFHWMDLAIIGLVGLIVFGPKRLPEIGKSVGQTIRSFQASMREPADAEKPTALPTASKEKDPE